MNAMVKTLDFFTKQKKQVIALTLTFCILVSILPPKTIHLHAAEKNPESLSTPILGTSVKILPEGSVASAWLGEYAQDSTDANDKQPIKWSIVLKDVLDLGEINGSDLTGNYFPQFSLGAVTLISEKILDTCEYMNFNSDWYINDERWHVPYSSSKLNGFLDGTFKSRAFSSAEKAALSNDGVYVWGGSFLAPDTFTYVTESVNAQVFAPDLYIHGYAAMKGLLTMNQAAEVTTYAAAQKWSPGTLEEKSYWLRTVPRYYGLMPSDQGMSKNGRFFMDTSRKARSLSVGIRPMTRVMDSHIILVSQVGAKNSTSVSNTNLYGEKEYEFTLYDSTRNFTATPTGDVIYGDHSATVNLSYSGANVGPKEYISYILTDDKGNVYKYERLENVTSSSGSLSIEIDYDDFGNNNGCELRIFNEQINGDRYTDYASAYSTVEINRDSSYSYPIWINGTRLNRDNKYAYNYDSVSNTLYITDDRTWEDYQKNGVCYGIYAEGDLNIEYKPYSNTKIVSLTSTGQTGLSQTAIYVTGDLTITGNNIGQLIIDNELIKNRVPEANGIVCGGKLSISNIDIAVDTGNGLSMSAIKAKSVELNNVTMKATTMDDLSDVINSSNSSFQSIAISCESYFQNGGTATLNPEYGSLGYTALMLLGEGKFDLDGKATLSLYGDESIGGTKTLEEVIANKDITVTTNGVIKTLKFNSCSEHTPTYRTYYGRLIEECHYCKDKLGQVELRAPADVYYDGEPVLVNMFGNLPHAGELTVTYRNRNTNEITTPIEVGNYRAFVSVGSVQIYRDFSIVENVDGQVPKTEFQKLQEKINAGGYIEIRDESIYAESTDKSLVIPEGVEVNIRLIEADIDRSAATEPGPVFDVRGSLKLEGNIYVSRPSYQEIRGGTDSGIIVRPGGKLEFAYFDYLRITGNTSKGPGAGIYCAGTLVEGGDPQIYGNKSNGKESGIHIASGGELIYSSAYFTEGEDTTVQITTDDLSKPIAVSGQADSYYYTRMTKRHLSGYDNLTTRLDEATGKLYLAPKAKFTLGTYIDHYTSEESGVQTINRSDFNNSSTLDLVSSSKAGSLGYIQVKEGSANKNVQLSFTTFSISMVVPGNTTYTVKHSFDLTMARNSSGTLGYYGEIFYLGDNPNQNLTFTRGDTKNPSSGSSGKAYYESKGGGTNTISVTATYKNESCADATITQWFGFYAGIGKATTYNHQAEFQMNLASSTASPLSSTSYAKTHIYPTSYERDSENHWKVCDVCGEIELLGPHIYDNNRDETCNTCGYVRDISCIDHIYDNDCDDDCNVCGEERTISHDWQTEWSSDGDTHWHECSVCHVRIDEGSHTPEDEDDDCTTAVHCSVCHAVITPAQSHDFSGDWLHDEDGHWHQCSHSGCTVTDAKEDHIWIEGAANPAATYFEDGQRIDTCELCGEIKVVVLPKLIDNLAPTGTITVDKNSWNSLLNNIPFGLFFKTTQSVRVASDDGESGVDKTYYYLSHKELSEEEAKEITTWTEFKDSFNINPNNSYVIYIKITDKVGNSSIINTEGLVLDNILPHIGGVTDGKTYCGSVTVTVTDDNLDTVKVNGNAIILREDKFTLYPSDKAQTIIARDKSGNEKSVSITVSSDHVWDDGVVTLEATASEKGVKTYTCIHCGETKREEIPMLAPSMIQGQNSNWNSEEGGTLTFRSNAAFRDFISVLVNGQAIDSKHYDVKEGSIIVTLKADYLATLPAGTHTLAIQSVTGVASTKFTIAAKAPSKPDDGKVPQTGEEKIPQKEDGKSPQIGEGKSPQTGDNSNILLWIALLLLSGTTIIVSSIKRKKQ